MKKKFWSNFFMGILAMGLIAGCSSDEWEEGGSTPNPDLEDAVYMNVQVQLPVAGAGTRSETNTPEDGDYGISTDGEEVGKDYENAVNRILLVLADKEDNLIGCGTQEGFNTLTNGKVNTVQAIKKSTLKDYYDKAEKDETDPTQLKDNTIHVYIFCNPTKRLTSTLSNTAIGTKEWVNNVATLTENPDGTVGEGADQDGSSIWGGSDHKSGFLMSTAIKSHIEKFIPKSMNDWNNYNSKDKAFDLTGKNAGDVDNSKAGSAIKVERSVARFDFKDGSGNATGENTYNVVKDDDGNTTMQIQLQRMGLVNMSKSFYYLRRVSADGSSKGSVLCDTELEHNYVVDTDVDFKRGGLDASSDYAGHFNFCLGNVTDNAWSINEAAREQWYNVDIKTVLGSSENDNYGNKEYKIWRYITENTIPAKEDGTNDIQRNGISTGIVFKGKMLSTPNTPPELKNALGNVTGQSDKDPILYKYNNKLYVRWTEVRAVALTNRETMPEFYKLVFGTADPKDIDLGKKETVNDKEVIVNAKYSTDEKSPDYLWGQWQDNDDETLKDENGLVDKFRLDFKNAATKRDVKDEVGFTLYQSSNDEGNNPGYFCYYYYWNRHNDNGDNGSMGPMEFAVVRNNVYKLAVTRIDELGHPRVSENDPDPKDPEEPDEKDDVYFKLAVEVLPWTVRVNNIEF